jgi:protoheme IX farnesyltransferase
LRSRAQAAARTSLHCSAVSSRLPLYRELTKPGITLFVSCSAATGYAVSAGASFSPLRAFLVWAATMLMSGGAAALNQVIELERDRMMLRTARRPLVSGQVSVHDATLFAWVLTGAGLLLSLTTLPLLTALFLALSHISYVNIYTPLKPRTPLCTLAGAFPGSLPVLAGAAAGAGGLNLAAWLLTGLLFAWQLPHFMAIGWLVREDYGRGGYAMLFLTDPSGRESAAVAVMYAAATGACALLLALAAPAGWLFVTIAALTGVVYSALAGAFFLRRDRTSARRLFFSSLLVLPALLATLVFEVRVLG